MQVAEVVELLAPALLVLAVLEGEVTLALELEIIPVLTELQIPAVVVAVRQLLQTHKRAAQVVAVLSSSNT
jgi:hypothetical protein